MVPIKKVLVTGSSGTIGTRLCEKLLEAGIDVVGVDLVENVWNNEINKKTIIGDLTEESTFSQLPTDIDLIIHLAATARVYKIVLDPSLALKNFQMLFNVLEFARKQAIRRFVFASSREVYGNSGTVIHHEDEAYVKHCESPYTASKVGGEALVHAYRQCYGFDVVILRYSNVYGMYDGSDRVVPLFIEKTKKGEDLVVYSKEKLLDFTYIDDCIDGTMRVIACFEDVKNNTFNIASGVGTPLLEVAQLVRELMGGKNQILIQDNRTGEVIKYIADIKKAQAELGYEPQFTVVEGIKRTIAWYHDHHLPGAVG